MRRILFSLILLLFSVQGVSAEEPRFPRNLSFGDFGSDVKLLQEFLNRDADTRVAKSGPGSPGNETLYFGPATRRAVLTFQNKYKSEVLAPVGLAVGSGFVGTYTRLKLQTLGSANVLVSPAPTTPPRRLGTPPRAPAVAQSPVRGTTGGEDSAPVTAVPVAVPDELKAPLVPEPLPPEYASSTNPNYEDIGYLLSAVRRVGKEQGYAEERIETLKEKILVAAATSTNFRERFIDEAFEKSVGVEVAPSPLLRGVRRGMYGILSLFRAKQVYAQSGTDFGGRLLFPFLCTCTGNWLMTLMPTAPTYVVLLTHYAGAQRFRNYNTPFTQMLLGKYQQGNGNCQFYIYPSCVTLPSQGATTVNLGSS